MFNRVKDDTSSLFGLRDTESRRTIKSIVSDSFEYINRVFDFDREVFASKVYRMATRSNMTRAISYDTSITKIHAQEQTDLPSLEPSEMPPEVIIGVDMGLYSTGMLG